MRAALREKFCNSVGRDTEKILSQSHFGAVSFARHLIMPEPKSVVEL